MFLLEQLETSPATCRELSGGLRPVTFGLRPEADGKRKLWYQGRERYFDVFLEVTQQRLTWAQFSLRGFVLSFDGATRYLRVDKTDEMENTAFSIGASRTLKPLSADLATRFTRIAMTIVAGREEDPYFAAFARQLRTALADQYVNSVRAELR